MDTTNNNVQAFTTQDLGDKFKVLTDASPDCIKLFNLENKVIYMNPGGLEEHGFKSLEDAIGFDWTDSVIPEQRDLIRQKIKESVGEKKTVSLDVKHLPQYANREWCAMIVSPVFDDEGKVKYFVGISRDISGRKQTEDRLKKYTEDLEGLNRMMIERELKMMNLSKENEELKEKQQSGEKSNSVV